ncbi:transposase [Cystobacter fuscus]
MSPSGRGRCAPNDYVELLRVQSTSTTQSPAWVVLNNGNIHRSLHVRRALPTLARQGVHLFYLPTYSPELNDIEAIFGVIKGHALPERSYNPLEELLAAVRRALRRYHLRGGAGRQN